MSQSVISQSVMKNTSILFILALSIPLTASSNDKISEASTAALQWLSNIDTEQLEVTWQDAASGYKQLGRKRAEF